MTQRIITMVKGLAAVALATTLVACGGGPGSFEGEWKPTMTGEHADAIGGMVEKQGTLVIGSDHIMQQGQKTKVVEMEITEQDGKRYLSIQSAGGTMALEIVDDDTLRMDAGVAAIDYKRV